MKRTDFVLVLFGVLHFLPQPCTARGSTNDSRAPPWYSSHSATRDEEESQKTSSHPKRQKTSVPLSQHSQSEGNTTARQKVMVTEHAGPVLSTVEDIHRKDQAFDLRLKHDDNETAPIRSYPTGRTQSKKTIAFVNEEDGRGKLKKTKAFWNVADGRSKPKTTMAVWDQTGGRWKEDVSPSLKKTQDERGIVSRRAQKGSIKKAPENGSIKEALKKGSNKEDLEKGSTKEPEKGYTKEAPEKGVIQAALEKGSNKEDPVKDSIKVEPETSYITEEPEKDFITETPGRGFVKEAPEKGFVKEASAKGSIKETQEDHIHKDRTEKLAVLTNLKKDLGETHTAPQLPQKRQNEGGIVPHARKGQNGHEAVSATPMKDQFENHPVSQHTQKDENVPGYTPDPWRQDVTGKGTTSSALQQDQEGMEAVALSLKKNQIKTEPVPHIGKTYGPGNGTALPPFGKKHSGIAANEADTKQNPRKGRANKSSSAAPPPREKERTVVLEEGGNKMEAEEMQVDSEAKPHKRAVYSLAVHRSERQVNNDDSCHCAVCNISCKFDGDFVNIAYNKIVTMSTIEFSNRPPCLLTNGIYTTSRQGTCIHSAVDDFLPWLLVDLGATYTFQIVIVVRRNIRGNAHAQDIRRMWSIQISVDGDICFNFAAYNNQSVLPYYRSTDVYPTTCYHVVTGRHLRLQKRDEPNKDVYYYINLCEIRVLVCKPGYFGNTSCSQCPATCKYTCDNVYGCDTLAPYNVALKKPALQSSTLFGEASCANDGDRSSDYCTGTDPNVDGSSDSWWQVDLGKSYKVLKLHVNIRVDASGNELSKHFDVYVENESKKTLSSPTKKCAEHRYSRLTNSAEVVLVCDTSQLNEGQFVILVTPSPYTLQLCEVRVMGHQVIELLLGQSCADQNEIKRCKLRHTCFDNICSLPLGTNCKETPDGCVTYAQCDANQGHVCKSSSNGPCNTIGDCADVASGFVCDSTGHCRLPLGTYCKETPDGCVTHTECDASQGDICKMSSNGPCNTTGDCANVISGFVCDRMGNCSLPYGTYCKNTPDGCVTHTECDASRGHVCKISSMEGPCNTTGDCANVISGFVCDSMGHCNCKKHKYGPTCSDTCGRCADDKPCNSSNGHCLACLTGWTPPPICQTAVPGLAPIEQIVVGVTVAVLLFWLLLAVFVALWHILHSAELCPCIFVGYKRRKKEEDGEDAEVSSDTGPPSKWSRFRKFIFCGGAGEVFLGVLFCISCGKLLSDKVRWRKEVIQNDDEDMATLQEQSEVNLQSPEKRLNPQAVDAKHTATSRSHVKKNQLELLRSDGSNKKSEYQAQFDGKQVYVDPHHSHQLSSDQYGSLLFAVKKNIEA